MYSYRKVCTVVSCTLFTGHCKHLYPSFFLFLSMYCIYRSLQTSVLFFHAHLQVIVNINIPFDFQAAEGKSWCTESVVQTVSISSLSLAGAATSIIFVTTQVFVTTKDMFCRDIIMFVATNICHDKKIVCHNKHSFVATKLLS